jgi:hypothetical protein
LFYAQGIIFSSKFVKSFSLLFMPRKVFNFVKWFLVVFSLMLVVIIIGAVALKKKLIGMGVQALNNELVVPVQVNSINFAFVRGFPYASMVLNNVVILSPKTLNRDDFREPYADTLLFVQNLYLSFNIRKLFNNQMELKAVKINNGRINILVDASGNDNFHILKPKTANKQNATRNMELMLRQLTIKQSRVIVRNIYKNNGIQCQVPAFTIKGIYTDNLYQTETDGQLTLDWLVTNQIKIVPLVPTQIEMAVDIYNDSIAIKRGKLVSKGLNFDISGNVNISGKTIVDLNIKGKQIELSDLLKYFSMVSKKEKLNIKSTGNLNFVTRVKGQFDNTHTPAIVARFGISNGTVDYPDQNLSISNVELKGGYNNGASSNGIKSRLAITDFRFKTKNSTFKGDFILDNFKLPYVTSNIAFDACLDEWNNLLFDKDEKLSGCAEGSFAIKGHVDFSEKFTIHSFLNLDPNGSLKLKKTGFDDAKNLHLNSLTGDILLKGNTLVLDKISGKSSPTTFSCSANIDKVFTSLFEPFPPMSVNGELFADKIDYKQIVPYFEDTAPASKFSLNLCTRLFVNQYTDEGLKAENVSTLLKYNNNITSADNLNFYAFGGRINTSLVFRPNGNDYLFACQATVDMVDVKQLFTTYKNFDQKYITYNNIDGKISGGFTTTIPFVNDTADWNRIDLMGHFKITDGKLSDIETTRELADFTKIDDFNHLEFSTLENDLLIKDQTISFSKMNIESNACDISVFGSCNFSGDYEYHFTIILADFMRGKARRIRQQVTPYGIVEDDGLGHTTLYLVASCENGKTKIKFDRQEIKGHFKDEMKQQKQEVKSILKKEFGLFKKDSTIQPDNKKKEVQKQFEIEWDDE